MAGMNKVILCGNSGDVAEIRYTKSGKAVANFSLATNDGWGDNKKTNWHKITCWDKTAEFIGEHLTKGATVIVEGRIEYREHEGKYYTDIIADRVELFKQSNGGNHEAPGTSQGERGDEFSDQEIPF